MENVTFLIIALLFILLGLISKKIKHSIITAPMVFVLIGLLFGSDIFGIIDINFDSKTIRIIAELTLVLVLFSDASRIQVKTLVKEHNIPLRLLTIGLPLTMVLGSALCFWLFEGLSIWQAAIVGIILTPTDAALSHSVVGIKEVPVRVRQSLNIESGLNDGLVVPFLIVFLSYANVFEKNMSLGKWFILLLSNILVGIIIGIIIGYVGGKIFEKSIQKKWTSSTFSKIATIALALLAYASAQLLWGNGFIAAFVAGITIAHTSKPLVEVIHDFAAIEGQFFALLLFLVFGLSIAGPIIFSLTLKEVVYALLSLTLVRMIPVWISLIGCKLKWQTYLYFGWFGPRGIASIVFSLMIVEQNIIPQALRIFMICGATILFSIYLHGLTAYPGAIWYAKTIQPKWTKRFAEHKKVFPFPTRYHNNNH